MNLLERGVFLQKNANFLPMTMRPGPHIYIFFNAQESRLLFSFDKPNFFEI